MHFKRKQRTFTSFIRLLGALLRVLRGYPRLSIGYKAKKPIEKNCIPRDGRSDRARSVSLFRSQKVEEARKGLIEKGQPMDFAYKSLCQA